MSVTSLIPFMLVGMAGSIHCVGMCGGIVSAFSLSSSRRAFPVPVTVQSGGAALASSFIADGGLKIVAFNAGRIGSYAIAGAIAGGVAEGAGTLSSIANVQAYGYWLANVMLVALGLYLMGAWSGLARIESAGQGIWKRVQSPIKSLMPADRAWKVLLLGGLWGWVPCAMVYSVLLAAMTTCSATSGAAVMLAFGIGTLPALIGMGWAGARLSGLMSRRRMRIAAGIVVIAFGMLGIVRASHGVAPGWLDSFCITPHTEGAGR